MGKVVGPTYTCDEKGHVAAQTGQQSGQLQVEVSSRNRNIGDKCKGSSGYFDSLCAIKHRLLYHQL